LPRWLRGEGSIPHGDYLGEAFHMDVRFLSLVNTMSENWDLQEK
jgi:hypothetical protein